MIAGIPSLVKGTTVARWLSQACCYSGTATLLIGIEAVLEYQGVVADLVPSAITPAVT